MSGSSWSLDVSNAVSCAFLRPSLCTESEVVIEFFLFWISTHALKQCGSIKNRPNKATLAVMAWTNL